METLKIKSVEEIAEMWTEDYEKDVKTAIKVAVHHDRASIHTSLVAAVEQRQLQAINNASSAGDKVLVEVLFDQVLTIINSIFKE